MFQHLKLWKEHAPVAACFGMFHPLFKPPAGTSHLLKRGESSVIQPILATPLIINRPNNYGQGNKTGQDTPPHSAPATTDTTCTSSPGYALLWNPATPFYTPHLAPAGWMADTVGQNWGRPKLLPSPFLLEEWDCFGAQGQSWKILISSSRG